MKYTTIILALVISGCATTVPVTMRFPQAPTELLDSCPTLEKVKDAPLLSDVNKTIVRNYTSYYECAEKTDGWIEWYTKQKKIYEGLNK